MHETRGYPPVRRLLPRLWCVLLCALLAFPTGATVASAQPFSEYDVEAAYLYNFGKFVRWPDSAKNNPSFDICILGQDPFGATLDKLIGSDNRDGKPIRKRLIGRPAEAAGCAIVYISDSEASRLPHILSALNGRGELLVSSLPHFVQKGGMIQFVLRGDRVRFQVNLDSCSRNHLVLSSELLKVAIGVVGKPQSGVAR